MKHGHSSNVQVGDTVYHVQTEDRGAQHPFIDTTVYASGRVLHRRTTSYYDVLDMDGDTEEVLRQRVEDQHRTVIDELRSGAMKVALPSVAGRRPSGAASEKAASAAPPAGQPPVVPSAEGISVKLLNAASWASAGKANLQIEVRSSESGRPHPGAKVLVVVEGALTPTRHETHTGESGIAEVQFALPKLGPEGGVLVIQASSGSASGQLRFQLRPRPRNPASVP